MKNWLSAIDFTDILIVVGLFMLAFGLSMISAALAFAMVGGILLTIGLIGAWRKGAS